MPRTLGGIVGMIVMSVVTVAIGLFVINRVGFISNIVYGKKAA